VMVGNPVRKALVQVAPAPQRYQARQGALRLLVVGGSLGAAALNNIVPKALGQLDAAERPIVTHQAGEKHLASLRAEYERNGVHAVCHAFIDDMAHALSD